VRIDIGTEERNMGDFRRRLGLWEAAELESARWSGRNGIREGREGKDSNALTQLLGRSQGKGNSEDEAGLVTKCLDQDENQRNRGRNCQIRAGPTVSRLL